MIRLHQAFHDYCSTIEGESELSRNWHRIIHQPTTHPIYTFTMVTCRDPKEVRSIRAPRGRLTSQPTSSTGGGPDSSAHEKVNEGGAGGLLLCIRAYSSEWAAFLGSKAGSSSGVGTPIGSSTLGPSDKAPIVGAGGAMGYFFVMSSISRSNRMPCLTRGMRHL